jgi:hypothetical protein
MQVPVNAGHVGWGTNLLNVVMRGLVKDFLC